MGEVLFASTDLRTTCTPAPFRHAAFGSRLQSCAANALHECTSMCPQQALLIDVKINIACIYAKWDVAIEEHVSYTALQQTRINTTPLLSKTATADALRL
ncbi:TPA: hypothetical protein ACH3X1_014924 [Trebouxia sp. C0004]